MKATTTHFVFVMPNVTGRDRLLILNSTIQVFIGNVLPSDIDSDEYSIAEIHQRLGGVTKGGLETTKLSLSTKLCLYSSLVLSVFLYGSETWATRKVDSDKIQAFHMTSQR